MREQGKPIYEFGPFQVDTSKRILMREGQPIPLMPKAFDTLLVLIENSDRVLEKDELIERLWPDTVVEENNLTQNISALRKALGESPNERRYIVTVPGRGYRFAASVKELLDEATDLVMQRRTRSTFVITDEHKQEELAEAEGTSTSRTDFSRSGRWGFGLTLIVCALVIVLAAGFYFWHSSKSGQPGTATAVKSLAVLPFKSLGPESGDEYLGIGMADTLITKLSNLRQVAVRPTSSVLKFGGQGQDAAEAGRELKVEAVLEGSVRRSGDRIRVTVQLVSALDGSPIWADKFDEKFTDIFTVEDSISGRVTEALALRLTGEERGRLTKRYTEDTAAYQLYLKGHYYSTKRTEDGIKKSIEYFEQAIEKDPKFSLAYAGLADSYILPANPFPPSERMLKGKEAALKALEIDNNLAEAHHSLAEVKSRYEWDWPGAEREFKRAIELNPNYATAHQGYALAYLTPVGRLDEATAEIKRAQELDPLSLMINSNLGTILYYARHYHQAIEQLQTTVEMDPGFIWSHWFLGRAYEQTRMYEQAAAEFQKGAEISAGRSILLAALAHTYAIWGKRDKAQELLDQVKELSKQRYVPALDIALIYTGLGENDLAFTWLERAYEEHSSALIYLNVNPEYDSLHSDARFIQLLRRIGLSQ